MPVMLPRRPSGLEKDSSFIRRSSREANSGFYLKCWPEFTLFTNLDRKAAKKNNQIRGPTPNQELGLQLKLLPDVSLKMRIEKKKPV